MKSLRVAVVFCSVVALAIPCFAHHMAVVVSQHNQAENLTSAQLGKIFRAETKKWPDGRDITLVLHRASPDEDLTLEHLNKISSARLGAWRSEHRDR